MEAKICMFTGHRKIDRDPIKMLPARVDALLEELIAEGYRDFRCGGAQGFDTIVALKVLEKRKKYPDIRLHLYLPCRDQSEHWGDMAKCAYDMVLSAADRVTYASERYVSGCMHARNRMMVEGSSLCVAYCSSQGGGTAYTVAYAQKLGIKVINLAK